MKTHVLIDDVEGLTLQEMQYQLMEQENLCLKNLYDFTNKNLEFEGK